MKINLVASSFGAHHLLALSLLCMGVGGCAVSANGIEAGDEEISEPASTEQMITQTIVHLNGEDPATVEVQHVTRAQQDAQLAARERRLHPDLASSAAPAEGQEPIGTVAEAITTSGCTGADIMINDGTSFTGTSTICFSGAGHTDLYNWCLWDNSPRGENFCPLGVDPWYGHIKSYSVGAAGGFLVQIVSSSISCYGLTTSGSCGYFGPSTVQNTATACEQAGRILNLGSIFFCL